MKSRLRIIVIYFFFVSFIQAQETFNHGNNRTYTPYTSFVTPVAEPTPIDAPVKGPISNLVKNVATQPIKGANSGIHFPASTPGVNTVRYDLYVTDTIVNYTGKESYGIAVNGSIPGPTLFFTIGDTALIYVHNLSHKPTSVHWHGVQLLNRMDGVAFLTQEPIPPHSTYIYKFPVVQSGTYWYHSHFELQEQVGLYGALIFNKRTEPSIPTIPVVLSDWSDTKPKEIQRMLHTGNEWFAIKKHSTQSYWESLLAGSIGVKLVNEWKRMHAMDVSDVYYERFLLNGGTGKKFSQFKAGDKVRLRIVNGSSSTYFWLTFSGGKLTVVANDGNDVVPLKADRIIIAPSETYDVILTIPTNMRYQFLATAEDRSGYASMWLGSGMEMPADKLPPLQYFEGMRMMNDMMKMNGDMESMGMQMSLQKMDMNSVMYPELDYSHNTSEMEHSNGKEHNEHSYHHENYMVYTCVMHPEVQSEKPGKCPKCGMTLVKKEVHDYKSIMRDQEIVSLNYNMLKATRKTTLPEGSWRTLEFELTGNMNRYVWSINGKSLSESDKILIEQGENLRIILHNNTMMRHPMHLHGHDFRLINQYGAYSPMKNVVDIMPMETDTLEFYASESGDWFFHCHILYHMMSGMGRIFSYNDNVSNPELHHPQMSYKMLLMHHSKFYLTAENDFATNGNDGSITYGNTRWAFQGEWRLGYNDIDGYEVESHFGRYFGNKQWIFSYLGLDWRYRRKSVGEENLFGQKNTHNDRFVFHVGIEYTLPWLIVADLSVDHTGYVILEFLREDIPLTPRLRAAFMVNSDREYMVGLKYILTKYFALSTHYDSDMGWGIGVTVVY